MRKIKIEEEEEEEEEEEWRKEGNEDRVKK